VADPMRPARHAFKCSKEARLPLNPNPPLGAGATPADRRSSLRKLLRTSAFVAVSGHRFSARTIDISRQGLSVHLERNLPLGTEVEVGFSLMHNGHTTPLTVKARVVHGVLSGADGFKIGLMLARPSDATQALIDRFLKA